jgi:EAL and modified HD-GYP domain-containing signal transduction protein
MTEVLEEMPLSTSTREALLGVENLDRARLDAVVAYERGEWEKAYALVARLGLPDMALPNAYADALRWARELSHGPEGHH